MQQTQNVIGNYNYVLDDLKMRREKMNEYFNKSIQCIENLLSSGLISGTPQQSKKMFVQNPPDSDFQKGFLSCALILFEEAIGKPEDERIVYLKNCIEKETK